ncbi:MAG: TetR/AcrR family transcriptional regulator [Thermoleophilaceae bacterium]|nr:TetR/AcrR family transcriptional regulator [Thermoleophilaceae bacterium]
MRSRADATAATGERILDAAEELFWELPLDQVSLDAVAARAEVSVQTVIRRFGGRDGLIDAAAERGRGRIVDQRATAPVGDVPGAVSVLLDHYERYGDQVIRLLAEEAHTPRLGELVEQGRVDHRDWCARVFAPALAGLKGAERTRRAAQLVAICDVYTWKLLRRDAKLSRAQTELALVELLAPLTGQRTH